MDGKNCLRKSYAVTMRKIMASKLVSSDSTTFMDLLEPTKEEKKRRRPQSRAKLPWLTMEI